MINLQKLSDDSSKQNILTKVLHKRKVPTQLIGMALAQKPKAIKIQMGHGKILYKL
jgi:hypothetical protein